jgi:hypothetical protein
MLVTKGQYINRISICKSCPNLIKPTNNCKICGCFMNLKARLKNHNCPKNYWGKIN